jgi:hypothetical protein
MHTTCFQTSLKKITIYILSCSFFLLTGCTNVTAQSNVPLDGTFTKGDWRIQLDSSTGTGFFIKVGDSSHKSGELFLKVKSRITDHSWNGRVYDRNFKKMQEGIISIEEDKLVITPGKGEAYVLMRIPVSTENEAAPDNEEFSGNRKRRTGRIKKVSRAGSGCTVVQCSAITKKGSRCRRTTSDCSGYCWQHS